MQPSMTKQELCVVSESTFGVTLTVHTAKHGSKFLADEPDFTINWSELSTGRSPPSAPCDIHAIAVPMFWGPQGLRARCVEQHSLWVRGGGCASPARRGHGAVASKDRGGGCASPARQGQSPASRPSTIDHAIDREVRGDRVGSSIFSSHGTDPRSKIGVQPGSAAGAASGGERLTAVWLPRALAPGRRPVTGCCGD